MRLALASGWLACSGPSEYLTVVILVVSMVGIGTVSRWVVEIDVTVLDQCLMQIGYVHRFRRVLREQRGQVRVHLGRRRYVQWIEYGAGVGRGCLYFSIHLIVIVLDGAPHELVVQARAPFGHLTPVDLLAILVGVDGLGAGRRRRWWVGRLVGGVVMVRFQVHFLMDRYNDSMDNV